LVSDLDIPDVVLFPNRYNAKTVKFYAGLELKVVQLGTVLMSYFVRYGLISNAAKFATPIWKIYNKIFLAFGSDVGGMVVNMSGKGNTQNQIPKGLSISWSLAALSKHGPQIPCAPAIIIAKKMAEFHMKNNNNTGSSTNFLYEPGARPCMGFFSLAEFKDNMKDFDIYYFVEDSSKKHDEDNLYRISMGKEYFDKLGESVKQFHSTMTEAEAHGTCRIIRGESHIAKLVATILRFPNNSEADVYLKVVTETKGGKFIQKWMRNFGGQPLNTRQYFQDGLLMENYGPFVVGMRIKPTPGGFIHEPVQTWLGPIPLPKILSPYAHGITIATEKGWTFDVRIGIPFIGDIMGYKGEITDIKINHSE